MSLVVVTPEKHVVKETEAGRMFRRLLKFDDIFTYFNAETGQWVLAYWVNKLGRVADEVEDLGPAMEQLTPQLVNQIVTCWKPVDWQKKKKMILSRQADFLRKQNEAIIEENQRYKWAQKRMRERAPVPYAFAPKITGGQVE